jgi:TolB-like protein
MRSLKAAIVTAAAVLAVAAAAHGEETERRAYVAILDFQILASEKDLAVLASEIPQALSAAFLKGRALKPVERQELEKALKEMELSSSEAVDARTAQQIGKLLGAKYLLLGSLTKLAATAKINYRLVRTETGEIVQADSVRGKFEELFDLEDLLAAKVEEYLAKNAADLSGR